MQGAEEEDLTARRERTLARSEYLTLKKRKRDDNKKWKSLGEEVVGPSIQEVWTGRKL